MHSTSPINIDISDKLDKLPKNLKKDIQRVKSSSRSGVKLFNQFMIYH